MGALERVKSILYKYIEPRGWASEVREETLARSRFCGSVLEAEVRLKCRKLLEHHFAPFSRK